MFGNGLIRATVVFKHMAVGKQQSDWIDPTADTLRWGIMHTGATRANIGVACPPMRPRRTSEEIDELQIGEELEDTKGKTEINHGRLTMI